MPELSFELNGESRRVEYEEGMNLLDVLRDGCGVTSPKDGCAPQGACGCCAVMVDGRAILSCLRKPESVEGASVTTLEGVPEGQRRVLAEAFVREGGLQCGYCTPGIAARVVSLLDRTPDVNEEQVRKALNGHICRCTGYQRIVDAVLTAADGWEDGALPENGGPRRADVFGASRGLGRTAPTHVHGIGGNGLRYRGDEQTLGDKPYVADMSVGGMLHGAVVLSRHPRAVVLEIDASGIDPDDIGLSIFGVVVPALHAPNLGREVVFRASLPMTIPGTTVNLACASSNRAITSGAEAILTGQTDVVLSRGDDHDAGGQSPGP